MNMDALSGEYPVVSALGKGTLVPEPGVPYIRMPAKREPSFADIR